MNNSDRDVIVIGVDPAPGKKTVMFIEPPYTNLSKYYPKNGFISVPHSDVKSELIKIVNEITSQGKKFIITWDAPLTGPAFIGGVYNWPGDFTRRIIESVFIKHGKSGNYKYFNNIPTIQSPKTIGIQGYGTCPHWPLSKHVFNLPKMCKDDKLTLEFQKLYAPDIEESNAELNKPTDFSNQSGVVEVHPALALWLWRKDLTLEDENINWDYKKNSVSRETIADKLIKYIEKLINDENLFFPAFETNKAALLADCKKSDDYLDALTAWLLGRLWINQYEHIKLVGTLATGAMLLPVDEEIHTVEDKSEDNNKTTISTILQQYTECCKTVPTEQLPNYED